jgi:hypothetical protein
MISYGIGGLVVAHVGRRLLFGTSPRQCAMPRHNELLEDIFFSFQAYRHGACTMSGPFLVLALVILAAFRR